MIYLMILLAFIGGALYFLAVNHFITNYIEDLKIKIEQDHETDEDKRV